jgi:hypothetical protein
VIEEGDREAIVDLPGRASLIARGATGGEPWPALSAPSASDR